MVSLGPITQGQGETSRRDNLMRVTLGGGRKSERKEGEEKEGEGRRGLMSRREGKTEKQAVFIIGSNIKGGMKDERETMD